MHSSRTANLAAALSIVGSISRVSAHGFVQGIVIGGEYYPGFDPSAAPYQKPPPPVIGWPNAASDTGFVAPYDYDKSNIVCHLNSSPGEKHATVAAGSTIDLQWNQWAESHHGPILDYMAKCDGECEKADKNALKFFKIAEAGLINGAPAPGTWASDTLRANNLTWRTTIPSSIAPGNYVLRHEIIALHSADKPQGAQNYPQCINLQVTGSGTKTPAGIPATKFYTPTDPGILLSIYYPTLQNYTIPGPPLIDGASSGSTGTSPTSSSASSVAVTPVPESSYAAESTPATVSPKPELSSVAHAAESTLPALSLMGGSSTAAYAAPSMPTDVSSMPESSASAYAPESTTAFEAAPSAATSKESSMMATSDYPATSMAPEEMCSTSTTTRYTTITMTTTVQPGSATTDVSPTSSEAAAMPTSSAETSSQAPETPTDSYPTGVAAYMSPASPMPAESVMPSSNGTSFTAPAPSAVESATKPTASATPGGSDTGLPGGMNIEQFIEWLKKYFAQYFGGKGDGRKHARDLVL